MCKRYIDWLSFACPPTWGPGPQPRHVPWLGIEPATFQLTGRHSIHWAIPARAHSTIRFYIWKELWGHLVLSPHFTKEEKLSMRLNDMPKKTELTVLRVKTRHRSSDWIAFWFHVLSCCQAMWICALRWHLNLFLPFYWVWHRGV